MLSTEYDKLVSRSPAQMVQEIKDAKVSLRGCFVARFTPTII